MTKGAYLVTENHKYLDFVVFGNNVCTFGHKVQNTFIIFMLVISYSFRPDEGFMLD